MGYLFSARSDLLYRQIEQADLFACVGGPLDGPFDRVASWNEAIENWKGFSYETARVEESNELSNQLPKAHYQRWNIIGRAIIERFDPLVERKIKEAFRLGRIPAGLLPLKEKGLYADITFYAMECEYGEFVEPGGILCVKADLYLRGYFPCGWNGDYPQGRLVVF